ncbi:MAG: hypothetical protein RLZZ387_2128 [Chloroflexota bacterium]|jgi:hypothetical protein
MQSRHLTRAARRFAALLLTTIVLAACGGAPAAAPTAAPAEGLVDPAAKKLKVGFLYVGPVDDYGYNYAADQGRLYAEKELGDTIEVVTAENVPEDANAERVMEQMISDGATLIFPTSYGHFGPAVNVSEKHKDVTFLHQGGLEPKANVSSYFGEIWQMVYAAGVAAGKMTKTNKLGYIVAFPIPQTLLNINAFQLGAKSVNPDVTTSGVHRQLVRPGEEQRGGQQPDRPGHRCADAAPGLPEAGDRGGREARRDVGGLPRRRQHGGAEGLDHGGDLELGPALHQDDRGRDGRQPHDGADPLRRQG